YRLVAVFGEAAVIDLDVVVVVPRLSFAAPNLDEPDTLFQEPPANEQLPRLGARAVQVADVLRLPADIEGVGGIELHAIGQLERLDAGFELGVLLAFGQVSFVELLEQIELLPLLLERREVVANMLDELLDIGVPGVDVGA